MGTSAYPAPRIRGAGAGPGQAGAGDAAGLGGGANGRVWPFNIAETSGVSIVVSQRFTGPAIIDSINLNFSVGAAVPLSTLMLYASDDPSGQGSNQPVGTIPSGQELFDLLAVSRDDAVGVSDLKGIALPQIASTTGWWNWPIKKVIQKSAFYLKLRINCNNASLSSAIGYVTLAEGVPPSVLANFR